MVENMKRRPLQNLQLWHISSFALLEILPIFMICLRFLCCYNFEPHSNLKVLQRSHVGIIGIIKKCVVFATHFSDGLTRQPIRHHPFPNKKPVWCLLRKYRRCGGLVLTRFARLARFVAHALRRLSCSAPTWPTTKW